MSAPGLLLFACIYAATAMFLLLEGENGLPTALCIIVSAIHLVGYVIIKEVRR